MLLFSIIHLTIIFIFSWFNIWSFGYIGIFYIIISSLFFCVLLTWWDLYSCWLNGSTQEYSCFFWAELGNQIFLNFNFRFDFFTIITSFVVITASLIVFSFVFFDMWDEKHGANFMINLGFFACFMLIMVNSGNLVLFYLGWEGIGLTSLFLVSFWSERVRSVKATIKIYIINKIGDFFFLLLISSFIIFCGDLDFCSLNAFSPFYVNFTYKFFSLNIYISEILGIILFFTSCVKSAQYGFHIWLLEAMEAPLGASALMHSSTLVIAGLVLNFKLATVVELSKSCQFLMFFFGSLSALFGAFLAMFQYELKVIMAYSTISNMGYMFLLFSLNAYKETILVMIFHAYIKIFLFIVVGSIMLHCNGLQDIRWMGGLFIYAPTLFISYCVAGLGLVGLPFLSGYSYKYALWQISFDHNSVFLGGEFFIFFSFIFTFFYVFRTGYIVFFGSKNGHRSIYKKKYYSSLFIFNLFTLSLILMFSSTFFNCLLDSNLNNLSSSFYYDCRFFYSWIYLNFSIYSLYLWVVVYFTIFLFLFFWYVYSINFSWNFLKYWYLCLHFFFVIYFIIFNVF